MAQSLSPPAYYSFDSAEASQQTEAWRVKQKSVFQKGHVGFLINMTTYSYEVFAGIKLAGELSVDLS